jgi:hypothetical protein
MDCCYPQISPIFADKRLFRSGQSLDEILTVHIIQENVLASITPAHHMIHRPRIFHSQLSGHRQPIIISTFRCQPSKRTKLWVDPFTTEFSLVKKAFSSLFQFVLIHIEMSSSNNMTLAYRVWIKASLPTSLGFAGAATILAL